MMTHHFFSVVIFAGALAVLLSRAASQNGVDALSFPESNVTATIKSHLRSTHALGLAVAVVRNGRVVYERGFGVRNRRSSVPVDVDTRFEIGSNTKQFTAAAILQLNEHRKLALDDRLAKYVPSFPHARELTLRELLNQTTGLFDYVLTNHMIQITQTSAGSFEKIERMVAGPLHFAPGSQWEYSNTNYIALGRVIEVASGESYNAYIRTHLLAPAHMQQTTTIDHEQQLADVATGYWRGQRNMGPLTRSPEISASWAWSAGEIVSTVGDLVKWDCALASGRIISTADFALMTTAATLYGGKRDDYGFAWWIDPLRGHKHVYHDGDTYGMSSSNNLFPSDDLTIIVLENEARDAAAKTAAKAFEAIVQLAAIKQRDPSVSDHISRSFVGCIDAAKLF